MKRGVGLKWSLKSLLTTLVLQIPEAPERAPGELNRVHRYERDRQVLKSWPAFSKTQSAKGTLKVSQLDTRGFSVSLLAIWSTPRIWRHQSNRKEYFHPTQLSCLLWACAASWYHSSVRESGTPCPSLHRHPQSYLLILILPRVVFLQPVCQGAVLEGAGHPVLHLDLAQGLRVGDHLHHPCEGGTGSLSREGAVGTRLQVPCWMLLCKLNSRASGQSLIIRGVGNGRKDAAPQVSHSTLWLWSLLFMVLLLFCF